MAPNICGIPFSLNRGAIPGKGHPVFSEIGQLSGVQASDWSWSALLVDLDNDSFRDLVVTNGYPRDITNLDFVAYKMAEMTRTAYTPEMQESFVAAIHQVEGIYLPNKFYRNAGDLTFDDRSFAWGFRDSSFSHGAAYGDLDNDGDLDLVIHNSQAPAWIMENTGTDKHYLRIQLKGPDENPFGFNTKVWVYTTHGVQMQEFHPVRGFQSSSEPFLHFGVDTLKVVDSVHVVWPDGRLTTVRQIRTNQVLELPYPNDIVSLKEPPKPQPLLADKDGPAYQHQESHFADFHVEPLLPQKYSQGGPGIAVGDVNGDGREDYFVGGAFKQPGTLFIQQPRGNYISRPIDTSPKFEEDMGCLFFDAEGDGDLDLFVASGGSEFKAGSPYYQDRLYLNDGSGVFSRDSLAVPPLATSASCVVAHDLEGDGDLDLFVGGWLQPQQYPTPGKSRVLENQGGTFKDITEEKFPGLSQVGRVTSALWTDVNEDGETDLFIVGEWMPLTIFLQREGRWNNATHSYQATFPDSLNTRSLKKTRGWWNSIHGGDFDQDGDTDYILGNLGLNSPLRTSIEEPVCLYVADFDKDGKKDPILCHFLEGKEAPFHPKDDLQKQVFNIRRQFSLYNDFAEAAWEDFFPETPGDSILTLKADLFESIFLEKTSPTTFSVHFLPIEAQFAPVFGILPLDLNADSFLDVLLTGNSYAPQPMTGEYDALNGLVLMGNGKGGFDALNLAESGFWVPGDGKSLVLTVSDNKPGLLAAENTGPVRHFAFPSHVNLKSESWSSHVPYVILEHPNGRREKRELYHGAGYLSQATRTLFFPESTQLLDTLSTQ